VTNSDTMSGSVKASRATLLRRESEGVMASAS
jgi:hypothetical protein